MTVLSTLLVGLVLGTTLDKRDIEQLQDSWTVTSAERDGQAFDLIKGDMLTIKGDAFTLKSKEGEQKGTMKLAADKKPFTLDITYTDGPAKGKGLLAIWEMNGDELKICWAAPTAKERPSEMSAKSGSGNLLVTLKREKK